MQVFFSCCDVTHSHFSWLVKETEKNPIIQSRSVSPTDPNYPSHALHIWAENALVDEHNNKHLQQLSGPAYTLEAVVQYPINLAEQDIDKVLSKGRSDNGGLDAEIQVKNNATVMLSVNVDINDRLVNGQMGTIARIVINQNTSTQSVIFIKFDDCQAGVYAVSKCTDRYARENNAVPIQPVLARIKVTWKTIFTRNTKITISYYISMGLYSAQGTGINIKWSCCYRSIAKPKEF